MKTERAVLVELAEEELLRDEPSGVARGQHGGSERDFGMGSRIRNEGRRQQEEQRCPPREGERKQKSHSSMAERGSAILREAESLRRWVKSTTSVTEDHAKGSLVDGKTQE